MKLAARQIVEGTHPRLYMGHRVYVDAKTGRDRISRHWYVEWNENGVKRSEALRTTNKQAAIRKAHKIAERIARGELPEPPSETLEHLTGVYLETLSGRDRAPRTVEKYTNILERFVDHAGEHKIVFARQYTETHFWSFSQKLIQESLSPKTRYNYLTIIKQMFRWAARNRRLPANPLEHARLDEPGESEQPVFTAADVSLLLQGADPHERAIYTFLAYTGARFGEARDVTWDDLLLKDGKHGFVVIRRGGSGTTTKSRRSRRIPIHPELRKVLDQLPRHSTSRRLFHARPSEKYPSGDGPIDERRILRGLKRLCVTLELAKGDSYMLHKFRHFFASMLASQQVSYKYALEFMGHSSSRVLDLYYTMYDPVAEEAILAIGPRSNKGQGKENPNRGSVGCAAR
jgi:integrase